MKRMNPTLLALTATLAIGSANAATVALDSALIPIASGYGAGDSFQLVFVTSTRTNMSDLETAYASTLNSGTRTIATFNAYVNDIADTSSIAGIADLNWSAIASTSLVDAKDNVAVAGPVHRLNDGAKVADNAADMWDGSIDNRITGDESGNDLAGTSNWQVWSGTDTDGTVSGTAGLDSSSTRYAAGWNTFNPTDGVDDPDWINLTSIDTADSRVYHFYAVSEAITIVPEPGSLALMGLGGLLIVRRRRRG